MTDRSKHGEMFCGLADSICKICIETLPQTELARLIINVLEHYQTIYPISTSMRHNEEQVVRQNFLEKFNDMDAFFNKLKIDLQMSLLQKEIELDMRENQLVKLRDEARIHYDELIAKTNAIFTTFEKQSLHIKELGASLGVKEEEPENVQSVHNQNLQNLKRIKNKTLEQIEEQIEGKIIMKKRLRKEITKYVQTNLVQLR